MRYFFVVIIGFFGLSLNAQSFKNELKTIKSFLAEEYPKEEPGAVVLVAKNGEILLEKAYGLASIKPKRKMKIDMVFPIASMSKQFTSAAILQLIENGQMALTDSIQQYVPYYPSKKYTITIHHLLSQTSGIPEYFDVDENEFALLAQEHTPKQLIAYYKDAPLDFQPGEKWVYSNSNYPLLGAALEQVTGLPLKDYMSKNLFEPLGMKDSGLWYPPTVTLDRIPTGYNSNNAKIYEGPKMVGSALYAPGGVVSSVKDLLLWNTALKEKTTLSEFVVNQLTTEKSINDGTPTGYGYGLFLRDLQGSPTIEHGGELFSFTSGGLYLPEEDIFICILSNTKLDRVRDISNYIASVLIGKPLKILGKDQLSAELLKIYLGNYKLVDSDLKRAFEIKILDNRLLLHDPNTPANDALLTPSEKDRFTLKAAGAIVTFQRDTNDEITGFTVSQKGDTYVFEKY